MLTRVRLLRLNGLPGRIFEVIARGRGNLVPTERILELVYPEGKPEHAAQSVRTLIYRHRDKLRDVGLILRTALGRSGGYYMERLS